jgi:ABC-2 type transport system ATP-binding protein
MVDPGVDLGRGAEAAYGPAVVSRAAARPLRPAGWPHHGGHMIEIRDLTRRYGGRTVLDAASLTCPPGTVTALLGPNGAGKSTLLRTLCGLARPDGGYAHVDGLPFAALADPGRRVGVSLDPDAAHPGRTGRESLLLAAAVLALPAARVDAALERVGLSPAAARRRIGGYSAGMRARLGLAVALLADPPCLVLDEPVNGLDPAGMRDVRLLLRAHADGGGTVLLSSHLLAEVRALADRLVVLDAGRVVAQGATADLVAGHTDLEELYLRLTGASS